MVTIIMAHPWHGSFNKAILDRVIFTLENKGKEYNVIDLNKDGFNPVYSEEDLKGYKNGEHGNVLVGKYQNSILDSDEIIFIFLMLRSF